jgi:antitoxin (DNA-binding transcriptional repressor) of toxin-antitoxin stability system
MSTQKVSVREARRRLPRLLDQVQAGDEVLVLRRGVEVGRLVRPERKMAPLPDLSGLRASVKLRGRTLTQEIKEARRSSRY